MGGKVLCEAAVEEGVDLRDFVADVEGDGAGDLLFFH